VSFSSVILKEVQSSNITHVGYDGATQTLFIRFRNSGTYRYDGVSAAQHKALVESKSIGKHFHEAIRSRFEGVKLPDQSKSEQVA